MHFFYHMRLKSEIAIIVTFLALISTIIMIIYIIIEFPNIYCIITVLLSTESFVEKKCLESSQF